MQYDALCNLCRTQQRLAYNVAPYPAPRTRPSSHGEGTRGDRDGIHPVETVISRIASPLPRTATIARASHSSLAPSPADRSWACHSSVSEMRPSWGSTPPFPPSSPPTTEAHTACPQPRHVRSRHLLLPSESSSLEEYVYHSCNLWDAPGEEVSGRSQVRAIQSNPLYRPVPLRTILCGNLPMSIVNKML